ncbi:hypothetical protein D9M71_806810 [compost metagenome]
MPVCKASKSPSLIGEALVAASCRLANAALTSTVAPLRLATSAEALMNEITLAWVFSNAV